MILERNALHNGGVFLSFMLFILIISSCRKDNLNNEIENDCEAITQNSQPPVGDNHVFDADNVTAPSYNPNNSNEIAFKQSFPGGFSKLYTFNISTKTKKMVWSGQIWSAPKWGSNNWIIFGADHNIFKIKADGSSYTQLTFTNNCYFPIWTNIGDEFLCQFNYDINNHTKTHAAIFSAEGTILDTIKKVFSAGASLNSERTYVASEQLYSNYALITVNVDNSIKKELLETKAISSLVWLDNQSFLWNEQNVGLKIMNVASKNVSFIKQTCYSKSYRHFDYHAVSDKILCSKITRTLQDDNHILFKERIVIMNTDGTSEQELDLSN